MAIKFPCPNCHKGLTAKDEQAGKKVVCPACKKPLVIPKQKRAASAASSASPPAEQYAPQLSAEDVEAAAAAMFSDGVAQNGVADTIAFTCEYCDAAISLPATEAGKRVPCTECRRIVKVPAAAKVDPSNWRKADRHLPSAAKAPDEPAPEGAWGNVTRTVVSREALEEAEAIPEKPEPVPLAQQVSKWSIRVLAAGCLFGLAVYGYHVYAAGRERRAIDGVVAFAAHPRNLKVFGPEQVAALHTLLGTYYLRAHIPYSDSPIAGDRGSAQLGQDEFGRALRALQDADQRSGERDAALADLAAAMADLGGDRDQARDGLRLNWEECLRRVRAALTAINAPDAKIDAYRAVSARLVNRGQNEAALALASTAFADSPALKAAARARYALDFLDEQGMTKAYDELSKEYEGKDRPPLAAEVVTLAVKLGKLPPKPGKLLEEDENYRIGEAEGLARGGKLRDARAKEQANPTARLRLRALVATGSATPEGAGEFAKACSVVKELPEPARARESWLLLRLVRLATRAGIPDVELVKVADGIVDPSLRARARLELLRERLRRANEIVPANAADTIDAKTAAGALARADLARHNARYDATGTLSTAASWTEPLWAFGTMGAYMAAQKDSD
jgi:hypothetical protein